MHSSRMRAARLLTASRTAQPRPPNADPTWMLIPPRGRPPPRMQTPPDADPPDTDTPWM